MSRRQKRRPQQAQRQQQKPPAEPAPEAAADEAATLRDELREFGLEVETPPDYDPQVGEPILARLLDGLRRGGLSDAEQIQIDIALSEAKVSVGPVADEEAEEEEDEESEAHQVDEDPAVVLTDFEETFDELEPPEVAIDVPVLEGGPLAAGIQIAEAMLTEAKAGYITAQIEALEVAINEEFTPHERGLMVDAASKWRDASGLPDVPGAYQALVVHRAANARREG